MNRASRSRRLALALCLLSFLFINARAQKDDVLKVEVGVQFSSLGIRQPDGGLSAGLTATQTQIEPGFGGRITYNLNSHLALEAEGNFFPHKNFAGYSTGGRVLQAQFGVKAGKRFEKFGVFAKARPGFVSFGNVAEFLGFNPNPDPFSTSGPFNYRIGRKAYFSTDLGGVLEFYPSRRILTRFDAGDTMIRYGQQTLLSFIHPYTQTMQIPVELSHNFQFSAGVGFRF